VVHEEWLEKAEVYALGALDGDELAQFEAHLPGCSFCRERIKDSGEILAAFSKSLVPIAPPSIIKSQLFDRIDVQQPGYHFIHAAQGEWQEMAPGIVAKILNVDTAQQRVTALVRMAPGSRYGNHRHTQTEELYVLEGSCYCAGRLLGPGDYHRAEAGSIHLDTHTEEGSLMLMIASVQNEMLG